MTTTDTNLASSERGEVGDAVPPMNAPHTEPKRRAKAFTAAVAAAESIRPRRSAAPSSRHGPSDG